LLPVLALPVLPRCALTVLRLAVAGLAVLRLAVPGRALRRGGRAARLPPRAGGRGRGGLVRRRALTGLVPGRVLAVPGLRGSRARAVAGLPVRGRAPPARVALPGGGGRRRAGRRRRLRRGTVRRAGGVGCAHVLVVPRGRLGRRSWPQATTAPAARPP